MFKHPSDTEYRTDSYGDKIIVHNRDSVVDGTIIAITADDNDDILTISGNGTICLTQQMISRIKILGSEE